VVHGCWAVAEKYKDRLVLCPTEDIAFAAAKGAEGGDPDFEILAAIKPHLQLWSEACFLGLEKRINEANAAVILLNNRIALNQTEHPTPA
jgi:hypothetical protein